MIIDADVVDAAGTCLGSLIDIAERAVEAWEATLIAAGVTIEREPLLLRLVPGWAAFDHAVESVSSVGLPVLAPVCPNCHAMLHQRMSPLTIEELRGCLR